MRHGGRFSIWSMVPLGCGFALIACTTESIASGLGSRAGVPAPTESRVVRAVMPAAETAALASAPAPVPASGPDESELREQLATATDPTLPALQLTNLLAEREQYREALAVVDTALQRSTSPPLRAARASLLRDLGQRHLAVIELRMLERELPADAIDAALRFELAEVEWLEGEAAAAAATLQRLQVLGANSAWLEQHRGDVAALVAAVQRGGPPRVVSIRDLLGNLRGAATVAARMAMLDRLLDATELEPQQARALHVRAVAIASGDESAAVRARVAQRGVPDPDTASAFFVHALGDKAPLVRRCAAPRIALELQTAAIPHLLKGLADETDAMAFLAMYDALAKLCPAPVGCSDSDAADPVRRAAIVAAWRKTAGQRP